MTNHATKLSRARRLSTTGRYPATYDALAAYLPAALIETATASQLAATVDSIYRATAEAKAIAARDAICDGGVWDARRRCFIDLAN